MYLWYWGSALIAQDFKQKLTRIDYWCDVGRVLMNKLL